MRRNIHNVQLRRGLEPRPTRNEEKAPAKMSIQCGCGHVVTGATKAGLDTAYQAHRAVAHEIQCCPHKGHQEEANS